jgi:hypothetical protein
MSQKSDVNGCSARHRHRTKRTSEPPKHAQTSPTFRPLEPYARFQRGKHSSGADLYVFRRPPVKTFYLPLTALDGRQNSPESFEYTRTMSDVECIKILEIANTLRPASAVEKAPHQVVFFDDEENAKELVKELTETKRRNPQFSCIHNASLLYGKAQRPTNPRYRSFDHCQQSGRRPVQCFN